MDRMEEEIRAVEIPPSCAGGLSSSPASSSSARWPGSSSSTRPRTPPSWPAPTGTADRPGDRQGPAQGPRVPDAERPLGALMPPPSRPPSPPSSRGRPSTSAPLLPGHRCHHDPRGRHHGRWRDAAPGRSRHWDHRLQQRDLLLERCLPKLRNRHQDGHLGPGRRTDPGRRYRQPTGHSGKPRVRLGDDPRPNPEPGDAPGCLPGQRCLVCSRRPGRRWAERGRQQLWERHPQFQHRHRHPHHRGPPGPESDILYAWGDTRQLPQPGRTAVPGLKISRTTDHAGIVPGSLLRVLGRKYPERRWAWASDWDGRDRDAFAMPPGSGRSRRPPSRRLEPSSCATTTGGTRCPRISRTPRANRTGAAGSPLTTQSFRGSVEVTWNTWLPE